MPETSVLLIVALVCVGIGYFAGLMLTQMAKDKQAAKETPREDSTSDLSQPIHVFTKLEVTLWSKVPNGRLIANLFGKTFETPADLNDADRKNLESQMNAVQSWLDKPIKGPSVVLSAPAVLQNDQPETVDENSPQIASELPAAVTTIDESAANTPEHLPIATPPNHAAAKSTLRSQELNMQAFQQPVVPVPARIDLNAVAPKVPQPAPKSIVEQIDEIIQEQTKGTPYESLTIRLIPSPKHGVDVWVGKDRYEGMENVPEGEAKQIIKAAITEWEKK